MELYIYTYKSTPHSNTLHPFVLFIMSLADYFTSNFTHLKIKQMTSHPHAQPPQCIMETPFTQFIRTLFFDAHFEHFRSTTLYPKFLNKSRSVYNHACRIRRPRTWPTSGQIQANCQVTSTSRWRHLTRRHWQTL